MITIRHAELSERLKTYDWLCCSDTTSMHLGPPDFPESPVPTLEQFLEDFKDFYFTEEGRFLGSVMIIENNGVEIGCICYTMFHLVEKKVEFDIWMKKKEYTGKGFGTEALKQACDYLEKKYLINGFMIRPSIKNLRAIRAYEKAGFKKVKDELKEITVKKYLKKEFINLYFDGDYGFENTAVLIKEKVV